MKPSTIADWRWRARASSIWGLANGVGGLLISILMLIDGEWRFWRPVWIVCVSGAFVFSGVSFLCHWRVQKLRAYARAALASRNDP